MKKTSGRVAIVADLRGRIQTGTLAPGSRLPAERDLAAEFFVSRASVRAAIEELVNEGLLEQRPRCRPTVALYPRKRFPSVRGDGRIVVWMRGDVDDIGFTLILKGIRKVLGLAGRHFAVGYPATSNPEGVRAFSESLKGDEGVEGVILWASDDPHDLPAYRSLLASGKSLVCIDRDPPGPLNADVVAVDHFRGARTAVEHLIALGHRRIGMVGNDDRVSSVRDRRDGYFSALRDAGIPWDEDLLTEVAFIHPADSESQKKTVEGVIDRYLALPCPPTALFAVNDQIAMHLQDALMSRGLSIPGDMSLVGFDWFLRWLPSGGDLTTVAQPFEKIGELAARRLLERIEGAEPLDSRHILLPAPLVVKSTTGRLVTSSGPTTVSSSSRIS